MPKITKFSFASGEVSDLAARFDLELYGSSAKTLINCYIEEEGAVSNRAGLSFLAEAPSQQCFIPFEFNAVQSYLLEFYDQRIRVYRNKALVTRPSDGAIVEIVSPYLEADISNIKYTQSQDTLFLFHPDYEDRTLTRTDHHLWTLAVVFHLSTVTTPGIPVLHFTSNGTDTLTAGATKRAIRYKISAINAEGEESIASDHAEIEVDSPWLTSRRVSVNWNSYRDPTYEWTASGSGTNEYYLEISGGGDPSVTKPDILYIDLVSATEGTVGSLAAGEWDYGDNDTLGYSTIYVRLSDGTNPDTKPVGHISFGITGIDRYEVYKNSRGFYGWVSTSRETRWVDDNVDPDVSVTPKLARNPFGSVDNYPGVGEIYQQRMVLARRNSEPQTLNFSQLGNLKNHNVSEPLLDSDAIEITIASRQGNEILHLVQLGNLFVFTSGAEWILSPSGPNNGIQPVPPPNLDPNGYRGSCNVRPLVIGSSVLFITRRCNEIFEAFFTNTLESIGYQDENRTLIARHLFKDRTIVSWAYQESPDSIVWVVMSDGTGLCMTHVREQRLFAWARVETDGELKSVASLPSGTDHEVYFAVRRRVNGVYRFYTEVLSPRLPNKDVKQAFFVDSGISHDNPLVITGITQASPPVVTVVAHGFSNDDFVLLDEIVWDTTSSSLLPEELNQYIFKIANVTANTFELTNRYTGTDLAAPENAYLSGGKARKAFTVFTGLDHLVGKAVSVLADGNVIAGKTVSTPTQITITGITQANPAVVTATAHGFSNGDIVYVQDVLGMTEVNRLIFTVANKTDNTFELSGINSTAYTAYSSGGKVQLSARVTLDSPAAIVHVGLPYDGVIKLFNSEVSSQDGGDSLGEERTGISAILSLVDSRGGFVSYDEDNLVSIQIPTTELPDYDFPRPLFTGVSEETPVPSANARELDLIIKQTDPLPLTVKYVKTNVDP